MIYATKKKAAAKKKESATKGRPVTKDLTGLKLFRASEEMPRLNEGSARHTAYMAIKNGSKYETFIANGGDRAALLELIKHGKIEARKA